MLGEKLKENITFRRLRSKVRASCRRCQARVTARDSGAMTSIEFPSCFERGSFLNETATTPPNDRLFNPTQHSVTMSAVAKNAAKAAGRAASRLPDPHKRDEVLKKGAKRDPELYVRHSTSPKAHLHTDESCNRSFWVSCLVPLVWLGSTSAANQPQLRQKQKYLLRTVRCHGKSTTTTTTQQNISSISIIRREIETKHQRTPRAPSTLSSFRM